MKKLAKYKVCGDVDATISGKLLYLILNETANDNGETIIQQKKISDTLCIYRAAVSRNLRRLQDSGYIDIQARYRSDDGGRAANKYIIK